MAAHPNPASDVAEAIEDASPVGGVTMAVNTNVFVGPERPVSAATPAVAVFCENQTGVAPASYLGIGEDFIRFQVLVTVRGDAGSFATGEALARGLMDSLQHSVPSGYVDVRLAQAGPLYLGQEPQTRVPAWTFLVECWWKG